VKKQELIEAVRIAKRLARAEAKQAVNLFFHEMAEALASGGRVQIRGLCSFKVKNYRGYAGHNPRTGEKVQIKPKKLPFFKAGKDLKHRVDK
jgi:integration host factor subunit beta